MFKVFSSGLNTTRRLIFCIEFLSVILTIQIELSRALST
jgi:hypothetical protein